MIYSEINAKKAYSLQSIRPSTPNQAVILGAYRPTEKMDHAYLLKG